MYWAFTPDSVFQSVQPKGSEATWQTSLLYSDIVPLIYVNKTICMVTCLSTRFKSVILWPGMNCPCQDYPKIRLMDKGPGAILSFETSLSFINRLLVTIYGEGNGNPLQCSCLENPRDGGAWWEAVYGVAQSRTRLKWLSSSSSSDYITSSWRIAGGYSFCPLLMPMSEAFSISFIL